MKWLPWDKAVHVRPKRRNAMARRALAGSERHGLVYEATGDTLVLAHRDPETGVVEVLDCRIRRTALVQR